MEREERRTETTQNKRKIMKMIEMMFKKIMDFNLKFRFLEHS